MFFFIKKKIRGLNMNILNNNNNNQLTRQLQPTIQFCFVMEGMNWWGLRFKKSV